MDQTPQVISTGNIKKMKRSDIPCRMGDNCTNPTCSYKHSATKKAVCIYFMRGHCRAGSNCNYFHSDTQSPQVAESEEPNNNPTKKIKAVGPVNVGAAVKVNPDGDFSAKKYVLKRKAQSDTKPNTDVADTSKAPITVKEDIKGTKEMPILIDSNNGVEESSKPEKAVNNFNDDIKLPPQKRSIPKTANSQISKRQKIERDEIMEGIIGHIEKKESDVIEVNDKKDVEIKNNPKENAMIEVEAYKSLEENITDYMQDIPKVEEANQEKVNEELKEKMQMADPENSIVNEDNKEPINANESKVHVIGENIDKGNDNAEKKDLLTETKEEIKKNTEEKKGSEEEIKKDTNDTQAVLIGDKEKGLGEKMEDVNDKPHEVIQNSGELSGAEKTVQPELQKDQFTEGKTNNIPPNEPKEFPKPLESKPIVKPVETEEAKAVPRTRKVKLADVANEFEEYLNRNPLDEELAKKYGITLEPDPIIEVKKA